MQEVGKWRGVSPNQNAQMEKTLTERKEEVSARLAQWWTHTFCGAEYTNPRFIYCSNMYNKL